MRLMGAWCRSSLSWIMTGCVGLPGRGRWRRWWLGSWAARREMPTRSPRWRIGLAEFPRCAAGLREGRLSLDQVGVIAARAGEGSDEHYAQLAAVASVNQLRTAVKLEPRPEPEPGPGPQRE